MKIKKLAWSMVQLLAVFILLGITLYFATPSKPIVMLDPGPVPGKASGVQIPFEAGEELRILDSVDDPVLKDSNPVRVPLKFPADLSTQQEGANRPCPPGE